MAPMPDSVALIQRLHEHRVWSNRRLREAAAGLSDAQLHQPFEIGQGSLWATLIHLYGAEYVWLEALTGNAQAPLAQPDAFESPEQLYVAWDGLNQRWSRYLEALTPGQLQQPVHRRSTSSFQGRSLATPAGDVLLHVATHAQYTTAQAANILRQLGAPPPDTMMITLSRSHQLDATRKGND